MRLLRSILGGLLVALGLLAATGALLVWLAGAFLAHHQTLLAPPASAAVAAVRSADPGLSPADAAGAAGKVETALHDPAVTDALRSGVDAGAAALSRALGRYDPSLGRAVASHPRSVASLHADVSTWPSRLEAAGAEAGKAAAVLCGAAFVVDAARRRILRRVGAWALSVGTLGLAVTVVVPAAVRHAWPHSPWATAAGSLAAAGSGPTGTLFTALFVGGLAALAGAWVWTETRRHVASKA